MRYEVFFEKGNRVNKPTSRTPSMRECEEVTIDCDTDDVETIKRLAQLEMRRKGKKGFRYVKHVEVKQTTLPGLIISIPDKKPFRIWNDKGTVRQSGWISLPGELFQGTEDEAGIFMGGMKTLEHILNNTFDHRQPDYFKPKKENFGTSETRL